MTSGADFMKPIQNGYNKITQSQLEGHGCLSGIKEVSYRKYRHFSRRDFKVMTKVKLAKHH